MPSLAAKNSVPPTFVRLPGIRAAAARVDVLDQDGAGGRAVALPKLIAVGAVVGREEERPAHVREIRGIEDAAAAGLDVLDHDGAGGRAVALPELLAVGAVIGREEERPADVRQICGIRASLPG